MQFEKVFVIGFNKTATSTFHVLFRKNGLTSQHDGSRWDLNQFQCFSDNGNLRDWWAYVDDHVAAIYILNTRPVGSWIVSRAKHCYVEKLNWGYPPTVGLYRNWILERNAYYLNVIRFFQSNPGRLLIVDISEPNWLEYICSRLDLEYFDLEINSGSRDVPQSHLDVVEEMVGKAMDELSIPAYERASPLLISSLLSEKDRNTYAALIERYDNNIGYQTRSASETLLDVTASNEHTASNALKAGLRLVDIKIAELEKRYLAVAQILDKLEAKPDAAGWRFNELAASTRITEERATE